MGKTATLNLRVNPDVKENAESVLAQLGIPMATAIDMYLKQISLVGGIPFSVVLPKTASTVNTELMSAEEIHRKLKKGYADIEKGNVGPIPDVIKINTTTYKYPHDYPGSYVVQQYMPDNIKNKKYYIPKDSGYEINFKQVYDKIERLKKKK